MQLAFTGVVLWAGLAVVTDQERTLSGSCACLDVWTLRFSWSLGPDGLERGGEAYPAGEGAGCSVR